MVRTSGLNSYEFIYGRFVPAARPKRQALLTLAVIVSFFLIVMVELLSPD